MVKHWFDFCGKKCGFWRLSQNPLVKHGAFVCSIDAAHQDLSDGMFILGVGPLVMVPEGFKSMDVQLFGGIVKRISKQLWMAFSLDWLVE